MKPFTGLTRAIKLKQSLILVERATPMDGHQSLATSRLFNIQLNNAYRIYCALLSRENYAPKLMSDCIADLTVALLQQGERMRRRLSGVPPISSGAGEGRKIRSDAKEHYNNNNNTTQGRNHFRTPLSLEAWTRSSAYKWKQSFRIRLEKDKWRSHQSVATICKSDGGYCV